MKLKFNHLLLLFTLFFSLNSKAQIDGFNVFENDQIISFEFTFNQTNFWDSLTTNYETADYMKADLTVTDNTGTYTFPDIGIRIKGNSSYGHPGNKKALKVDFNKYISGQNYDGLKKLNFSNGFKDPSLLREKVFFDVCKAAGVLAPRTNFANVYFNGTLWGFYTLVEQIDDQFLDWAIEEDDGNLFKAGDNFEANEDEADLVYYGENQSLYTGRYELKSNEDEDDWSDLIDFTNFIGNSSATVLENELENHIELQEYLRSLALDNLFSNLDSYTQSARNYYIYHNLDTDKWEWIKWDGNESFGLYGGGGGGPGGGLDLEALDLNYAEANRPLLDAIFDTPALYDQYLTELCDLKENFFNSAFIDPIIDAHVALIQEAVYADNNKMYSNANFDTNVNSDITGGGPGPGGGGSTFGLKSFVAEKNSFASGEVDCSLYTGVENIQVGKFSVYPNPINGVSLIEWEKNIVENVVVFNLLGQKIFQQSVVGQTQINIDFSAFKAGLYIISLYSEKGVVSKEIVVSQ